MPAPARKVRPTVKLGQIWIDRDRRARGRRLLVTHINESALNACVENVENKHKTIIALWNLQKRFELETSNA